MHYDLFSHVSQIGYLFMTITVENYNSTKITKKTVYKIKLSVFYNTGYSKKGIKLI